MTAEATGRPIGLDADGANPSGAETQQPGRRFTVMRYFTASTAPGLDDHVDLEGKVNKAVFYGLPKGTVQFKGLSSEASNFEQSGVLKEVAFEFEFRPFSDIPAMYDAETGIYTHFPDERASGWQIVEGRVAKRVEEDDAATTVDAMSEIIIHDVAEEGDFSKLGLSGVYPTPTS